MKTSLVAGLVLLAAPVFAQMSLENLGKMPEFSRGRLGHGGMFGALSDAGRATMIKAMRTTNPRADSTAMMEARDRMLALLGAERLDVAALKQAMDKERTTAMALTARHQSAMLAGFQQLAPTDRHAFVADARARRARM